MEFIYQTIRWHRCDSLKYQQTYKRYFWVHIILVESVATHGAESWTLTNQMEMLLRWDISVGDPKSQVHLWNQSHITPVLINFIRRYMFRLKLQIIIGPAINADTGKIICYIWRRSPLSHDSAWKRSSKTCMKLTSAERTVENSWWWAQKMPETCRVL